MSVAAAARAVATAAPPPPPPPAPPRARSTRRRALASSALVAAWVTSLGAGTAAGASAAVDVTPDDAAVDVAAVLAEARRMYAGGRLGDADAFLDAAATRMMMARGADPAAPASNAVVAEPPSSPFPPAAAPLLKLLGDVRVDALNAPAALRAYTAALAADPAGASAPGAFFGRANAREVAAADALASGDADTADAAYAAAVDDYGSCLALAPDAPDAVFAVFERAQAERALRRWEDARRDYDRAAEAFLGRREKKRSDLCAAQAAFAAFEAGDVAAARARLETLARRLYSSDVRAALVAVRWSEGDVGGAESLWLELCQLEGAACGKYADEAWVESYRRWTPGLAKRVGDFLALRGGGGETYEPQVP